MSLVTVRADAALFDFESNGRGPPIETRLDFEIEAILLNWYGIAPKDTQAQ